MGNLGNFLYRSRPFKAMLRAADFKRARQAICTMPDVSAGEKDLLADVSLSVHTNDNMYVYPKAEHYLSVGISATRCIESALEKAGSNTAVRSILSFPCGYGRELRFLKHRFPDARITACDIDELALDFCHREFTVEAALSDRDFNEITLEGKFDLIWSRSLITHLDAKRAAELLRFFHGHLSPGGICVFTTHGRLSEKWFVANQTAYGVSEEAGQQILEQLHRTGYCYGDYPNCPGYGISVTSSERIREMARNAGPWSEIWYLERGWDNHQDVCAFSNRSPTQPA